MRKTFMKKFFKIGLTLQTASLLPLAFVVRLFPVQLNSEGNLVFKQIDTIPLVLFVICVIWLFLSVISFFQIKAEYSCRGESKEYKLQPERWEILTFFVSCLIPFFYTNVNSIRSFLIFLFSSLILLKLIYDAKAFYANPFFCLLGYRVYKFQKGNVECRAFGKDIDGKTSPKFVELCDDIYMVK